MDIKGRVAVVTGAASGLGRAAAVVLASAGARVAALDWAESGLRTLADDAAGDVLPVAVDISDEASVDRAVDAVVEAYGAVHLCVNAAGIPDSGRVVSGGQALELASFRKVIEVNLIGTFDVMRRCVEAMARNEPDGGGERGVVINVSSGAAWQGQRGQAAYAASKAGLIGLTLPTARDLADLGVRVVTVAPGLFETGMVAGLPDQARVGLTGMILNPKRLGDPVEFAALVAHIAENRYINATTVSLDAGMRLV